MVLTSWASIRQRISKEDFLVGAFLGFVAGILFGLSPVLARIEAPGNLVDTIVKFTPLAAFVAASAAAAVAYKKYQSDRAAQQVTNAVTFYRRYLEIALQHTKYAEPESPGFDEETTPAEEYKEYEWFLGILFRACEELLEHSGRESPKWHVTIMAQLRYHKKYLRESTWLNQQGGITSYAPQLQSLIRLVQEEPDNGSS